MATQSDVVHGRKTVTTAGTPVAMGLQLSCIEVAVRALTTNTNNVVVGADNSVRAAAGSETGLLLKPTDPAVWIPVDDVLDLFVDAVTSGEGVAWLASVS